MPHQIIDVVTPYVAVPGAASPELLAAARENAETVAAALVGPAAAAAVEDADIPGQVAGAVAASPAVVDAAAVAAHAAVAAEVAEGGLVATDDPRLGQEAPPSKLVEVWTDSAGRMAVGVRDSGVVEVPVLSSEQASVAGVVTAEEAQRLLRVSVDSEGRMAEDAIGPDGRVPSWVLSAWKSRMSTLVGDLPPMDIWIGAGQSNMTAPDPLPAGVERAPYDPRLYAWSNDWGQIVQMATTPSGALTDTVVMEWARIHLGKVEEQRGLLVLQCAVGGTGFTSTSLDPAPSGYYTASGGTWDRTLTTDPKNLYAQMIARAQAALAAAPAGSRIAGFLWSQGEGDQGLTEEAYTARLLDLITQARTDLSSATAPVIVGSLNPNFVAATPSAVQIEHALESMPAHAPRVAFAPGVPDLSMSGQLIHWSAQGQQARATLFEEAWERARWNVGGVKPQPPQHLTAHRAGGALIIDWEHPPSPATAFDVQYRIDDDDWVPLTLATALARHAEVALGLTPAQTACVRARTTNTTGTSDWTLEVLA